MTASARSFSRAEALRFGWESFKTNLGPSLGIGAVAMVTTLLLNGFAQAAEQRAPLTLALEVLLQLAQAFFALVWVRFALRVHDARDVRRDVQPLTPTPFALRELVPDLMTLLDYLAVSILYGLLVLAGLLLLVVPGIYLAVRYGLVAFLVADRRADVLGAFHQSSELTRGSRWSLLLLGLLLLVFNLFGAMLFGIGLLVTIPISAFTGAFVYRRLTARAHERLIIGPPASPLPA
jgi:hypothetical protein